MKATKEQLKQSIGKEVWIEPLGNLKPRGKDRCETLITGIIQSVSNINVTFEKGVGIYGADKIKIDGDFDRHNYGGYIYLTKEDALRSIWRDEFIKDLRYNLNLSPLTYEDCKIIEQMLKKEQ
jgi:hypothetical protein